MIFRLADGRDPAGDQSGHRRFGANVDEGGLVPAFVQRGYRLAAGIAVLQSVYGQAHTGSAIRLRMAMTNRQIVASA